ncbi:MAG: Protein-export membrane protein SecF [Clostridia bacterium 62_21]|nr:MAG: Protein-export membrane protein SecF [Clostridia bacterium 62_21]
MRFHFINLRRYWYLLSLLIIIPGVISLLTRGLNLGIDFTGGNLMEVRFEKPAVIHEVRAVLRGHGLERVPIQQSGPGTFIIRTPFLSEDASGKLIEDLRSKIGELTVLRNEAVGPVIGRELMLRAIAALAVASVLMILYIWWRFEFRQGIAAVTAVLHDVLVTVGIFSLFQIEVNSPFVAAVLTVIGYSINDTIVIFDRIRENLRAAKQGEKIEDIVNASIWQTLARSINTVLTVLFMLVALYFLGGTTIRDFVLAMLVGITSGAYSSIFNASPLWVDLKRLEGKKKVGE